MSRDWLDGLTTHLSYRVCLVILEPQFRFIICLLLLATTCEYLHLFAMSLIQFHFGQP